MFPATMSALQQIEFVLKDKVEGEEIAPANIRVSRFNEFHQQGEVSISGEEKLEMDNVQMQVETGDLPMSRYDEAALDRFAEAGRLAWADVPDAAAWVRQLRGGEA